MIDQTTADKILTDMFESGWFHQDQIDYFEKEIINSLVSEPDEDRECPECHAKLEWVEGWYDCPNHGQVYDPEDK